MAASRVYDEGFYNSAVTPTSRTSSTAGRRDAFGKPLSHTAIAPAIWLGGLQAADRHFADITVSPERNALPVNGAAKTPTVRNIDLMHPHFHNGAARQPEACHKGVLQTRRHLQGGNHRAMSMRTSSRWASPPPKRTRSSPS